MIRFLKKNTSLIGVMFVITILGAIGTGLFHVSEGVFGSNFVNAAGGFSLIDEGEQLEWSSRVLHGQIPYKDFWTLYTPLRLYVIAGLMKIMGASMHTERIYFAAAPIIGFLAIFALTKLLTKNIFVSCLITILSISSHTIYERNSLYVLAIYLFARTLTWKSFKRGQPVLIAGVAAALAFWTSQEFGVYAAFGALMFAIVYAIGNSIRPKQLIRFLATYSAGFLTMILPYCVYLFINGGMKNFIQYVFIDFSSGPIAQFWVEPLPKFFLLSPNMWFGNSGFLMHPIIQTYVFITAFVGGFVLLLLLLRKNSRTILLWQILLIDTFGIMNLRGLFYSQSVERRQGILIYLYLILALITLSIAQHAIRVKKSSMTVLIGLVVLANWYALSTTNIDTYLNTVFEFITFTHRPLGILIDRPRIFIRVYPTTIDRNLLSFTQVKPTIIGISTLLSQLDIDPSVKSSFSSQYLHDFSHLGRTMNSIDLTWSRIMQHDPGLIRSIGSVKQQSDNLQQQTEILQTKLQEYIETATQNRQRMLDTHQSDTSEWFRYERQIRFATEIENAFHDASTYFSILSNSFTLGAFTKDLLETNQILNVADYLDKNSTQYAYGFPLPSVYLFIADKINPTEFSPLLSNISIMQQERIVRDLDRTKPCYIFRWPTFSDKSVDASQYLPSIMKYTNDTYTVEKSENSVEYLTRTSCRKNSVM